MTDRTPLLTLAAGLMAAHGETSQSAWIFESAAWVSGSRYGMIANCGPTYGGPSPEQKSNAAFIALAHTDIPALCAGVAEVVGENERLNRALKYEENRSGRQGTHGPGCHLWGPQHYECLLAEYETLSTPSTGEAKDV